MSCARSWNLLLVATGRKHSSRNCSPSTRRVLSTSTRATPRRVIRAIEVTRATGRPFSAWQKKTAPKFETSIVGLRMDRQALYRRIDERVDAMLAAGLPDEVRRLNAAGFGCGLPSMTSIGYRQICAYLRRELSLSDAVERIKTETHRLARMQHAWFRPLDPRIGWLDAGSPDLSRAAVSALARTA